MLEEELDSVSSEARSLQDALRQADRREHESREAMRIAASHFDNLQRVHEAELHDLRRQTDQLRTTIAKLKLQTVQHDKSTASRQNEFSQLAEALARSRARCEVLESTVQHLVIQSQEKDEHLHDVSLFMKRSLAPFVDTMIDTAVVVPPPAKSKAKRSSEQQRRLT